MLRVAATVNPAVDCIVLSSAAAEFTCPQEVLGRIRAIVDKTQAYERLHAAIAAVMRRHGIDPGPAIICDGDALAGLRPREVEVFRLIGRGMKTAAISAELGISKNTVETHRKSIAAKLGASGAELVRLATLHNQTSLPDG